MFSQGISIVIFIFQLLYILAVSAYPYFLKMPYRCVVVSVSAYPYPVLVQHRCEDVDAEEETDEEDENEEREDADHESESSNAAELGNFRKSLHRKSWLWSQQQVLFLVCYFSCIL